MATVVRKTLAEMAIFATAFNDLRLQIGAGATFHMDQSEQSVGAANATVLADALTLTNALTTVYQFHMADTLAHKVAGVALASYSNVADLASMQTQLNDVKAKYNTHIASTTFHYNADATNSVATANATDLATSIALANALKVAFNAHMASGPASKALRVVNA